MRLSNRPNSLISLRTSASSDSTRFSISSRLARSTALAVRAVSRSRAVISSLFSRSAICASITANSREFDTIVRALVSMSAVSPLSNASCISWYVLPYRFNFVMVASTRKSSSVNCRCLEAPGLLRLDKWRAKVSEYVLIVSRLRFSKLAVVPVVYIMPLLYRKHRVAGKVWNELQANYRTLATYIRSFDFWSVLGHNHIVSAALVLKVGQ
jgi:hypothetical protein